VRFLELNEAAEWCTARGGATGEYFRLQPELTLEFRGRIVWDREGLATNPSTALNACLGALERWDQCLLWITEWGIWSSSEDWPKYYAIRGSLGEKRSLAEAPGHLFETNDTALLEDILGIVLMFGWDAHLLPSRGTSLHPRVRISHDGWVELQSRSPIDSPWEPVA
jgi:hypothetical protein